MYCSFFFTFLSYFHHIWLPIGLFGGIRRCDRAVFARHTKLPRSKEGWRVKARYTDCEPWSKFRLLAYSIVRILPPSCKSGNRPYLYRLSSQTQALFSTQLRWKTMLKDQVCPASPGMYKPCKPWETPTKLKLVSRMGRAMSSSMMPP